MRGCRCGRVCVPMRSLEGRLEEVRSLAAAGDEANKADGQEEEGGGGHHHHLPIVVVCRRGNDSRRAAWALAEAEGFDAELIVDLVGGVEEWGRSIDASFPVY